MTIHVRAGAKPWVDTEVTDQQIAAAVAAVNAMPGKKSDPNRVRTFWPRLKPVPTISDVDFEDATEAVADIASLRASDKWLKRDRLIWHVQNPGQRRNDTPLTGRPLIGAVADGDDADMVIIDGHHALGALLLLGVASAPVWSLPVNQQGDEPPQL